jgi:hypothetical protein
MQALGMHSVWARMLRRRTRSFPHRESKPMRIHAACAKAGSHEEGEWSDGTALPPSLSSLGCLTLDMNLGYGENCQQYAACSKLRKNWHICICVKYLPHHRYFLRVFSSLGSREAIK